MKWKLMVPTIVIAGILTGMVAIVPSAVADHKDDNDDDNGDYKNCKKWFFKAYKEFRKHDSITAELRTLVKQCLNDGFESPWNLPREVIDDNPLPVLSGLTVDFMTSESEIPNSSEIIETKLYPCPTGKIIIDEPHLEMDVNAQVSVEIMSDRITLMMISSNMERPGTLVLVTPCLGVIQK